MAITYLVKARFPNPVPNRVHIGSWRSDEPVRASDSTAYRDYAQIYQRHVWVAKAINTNALNIASVPIRVLDRQDEVIEGHVVGTLLESPNPAMGQGDLWRAWVVDMMLAGEAFWEIVYDARRQPTEIWPRRPDRMGIVADEERRMYQGITGYVFERGPDDLIHFEPNDIIHFRFFNPLNPWRGLAPVVAVGQGIVIDVFAQAWAKWFFRNSARPDYAIESPEDRPLTASEAARLEAWIEEKFKGAEKSHRPIILEAGQRIVPFSWAPKDTEWLEQRKFSRDEIGAIFGVPDEIMGFGRDTYENFSTALKAYWRLTLMPLLAHRDETATRHLRRMGVLRPDERLVSDLSDVLALQENINEQIAGARELWSMGVPLNTAVQVVGLDMESVPGGDTGYLPFNLVPADQAGASPEPPESAEPPPAGEEPEQERTIEGTQHKAMYEYDSPRHWARWKMFLNLVQPRQKAFQRRLKKEFQRQQVEAGRRLRAIMSESKDDERKAEPTAEEIFDQATEEEIFADTFRDMTFEMLVTSGAAALAELGLDQEFIPGLDDVQAMIETMTIEFSKQVNTTTINELRDALSAGVSEGEGLLQLMDRVNGVFNNRKSDYETERIARTEMGKAANGGALLGYKQSAVVQEKEWLSALIEGRTRDEHRIAHGQRRALDADFLVGGENLAYPGDPKGSPWNIIFCLCTIVPVI